VRWAREFHSRYEDRISRLIILLSSLCSQKKIIHNVNQGTQDELHTIHDRINRALCSDIKRHNRVFAFVPARIRIRKKEKGTGAGTGRATWLIPQHLRLFCFYFNQRSSIIKVLLYRNNLTSVIKSKSIKEIWVILKKLEFLYPTLFKYI